VKIAELIDAYEGAAKLRGLAPTQLNALKPVRRGLGHLDPLRMTPKHAAFYVRERHTGQWTKGGRPVADGTIRRELGALSAVLNWAYKTRLLKEPPPAIDLPPPSPPRAVFLSQAQADMAWQSAVFEKGKVGLFVCLALDTWARADAIETLPWERVDFDRKRIDYRDPAKPETAKRRAVTPMSTRLSEILWPLCRERGYTGQPVVGPVTQYEWRKFKTWANLPADLTRHDLRRTGISLALARGVEPLKVAQMAGDNLETIMKHYAHFMPDYLDGVVT
jgi:integrase